MSTCVWSEPAAADRVWGLPGSLQKRLQNVLEIWLGFEARFSAKKMPKVSKMGSQMAQQLYQNRVISAPCWRTVPEGSPGVPEGPILVPF